MPTPEDIFIKARNYSSQAVTDLKSSSLLVNSHSVRKCHGRLQKEKTHINGTTSMIPECFDAGLARQDVSTGVIVEQMSWE